MGIKNFLKEIEKYTITFNVKELKNKSICIDGNGWAYKGSYFDSVNIIKNKNYKQIINYFKRKLEILNKYCKKIIVIFDGDYFPLKEITAKKRKDSKKENFKKANELFKLGKYAESQKYFNCCISITPEIVKSIVNELKNKFKNINFCFAPFESDAQLAYLNIINYCDYVITEDSDLVLFGAKNILFKMDNLFNFKYLDTEKIFKNDQYFVNLDTLRYICILSGCDYFEGIKGYGLKTSKTKLKENNNDIDLFFKNNKNKLIDNFEFKFWLSFIGFIYQKVYDPIKNQITSINRKNIDTKISNFFNNQNNDTFHMNKLIYIKNEIGNYSFLGKNKTRFENFLIFNWVINPITLKPFSVFEYELFKKLYDKNILNNNEKTKKLTIPKFNSSSSSNNITKTLKLKLKENKKENKLNNFIQQSLKNFI